MPRTAALLLFLVVLGEAALGQETTDANALSSQLQSSFTAFASLHARYQASEGEERSVLGIQLLRIGESAIASFLGLADSILAAEAAGRDVSAVRAVATDILEQVTRMKRADVGAARERLSHLRDFRNSQGVEDRLPTERAQSDVDSELDRHLEALLRIAGFKERLGIDARDDLAYLDAILEERAVALGAQVEVSRSRAAESARRLDQLGGDKDAGLGAENRASRERLEGATRSLIATVRLMESRGLDVSEHRQFLIRATGELSTHILDYRVALGLLRRGFASLRAWASERAPTFVMNLMVFGIIVLVFRILSMLTSFLLKRWTAPGEGRMPTLLQTMVMTLASKLVLLLGVFIGLTQVGVEIAPLLAGLGVAGFIVGFALQDSLSNFASGLMILIYRPFDVGHVVQAGDVFGKVSDMSLVSTTLLTFDNQKLVVPNSKIWGNVIRNLSSQETRRVDLVFSVDDNESTDRVLGLLREVVAADSRILDVPEPIIRVDRLGESSYDVVVRPWVATRDYWDAYWDLTKAVKDRFAASGIARPHPKHNVRIEGAAA
jgi:small conductance mechanosensitive channel